MGLLFLGSLFQMLHGAPHRDDAMLDGLARHIILDERSDDAARIGYHGARGGAPRMTDLDTHDLGFSPDIAERLMRTLRAAMRLIRTRQDFLHLVWQVPSTP
jgi:hypothetical protein